MHEIAPDVHQIALFPRDGLNAYLVGDVLVDAGVSGSAKKLLAALEGRRVAAHAITHAHVDHAGGSAKVTEALGIPMWVSEGDAEAVETGQQVPKAGVGQGLRRFIGSFDGLDVDRRLAPGDELSAGFVVVDAPGHSPGHVAFWRASDRVLVLGDVLLNLSPVTTRPGLHHPPSIATPDVMRNRASQQAMAALQPEVVAFGHGPVLRDDATAKLAAFVGRTT